MIPVDGPDIFKDPENNKLYNREGVRVDKEGRLYEFRRGKPGRFRSKGKQSNWNPGGPGAIPEHMLSRMVLDPEGPSVRTYPSKPASSDSQPGPASGGPSTGQGYAVPGGRRPGQHEGAWAGGGYRCQTKPRGAREGLATWAQEEYGWGETRADGDMGGQDKKKEAPLEEAE